MDVVKGDDIGDDDDDDDDDDDNDDDDVDEPHAFDKTIKLFINLSAQKSAPFCAGQLKNWPAPSL